LPSDLGTSQINYFDLFPAPAIPDNLFLVSSEPGNNSSPTGRIWHSADGGHSWQKLGTTLGIKNFIFSNGSTSFLTTPYAPLTLLGLDDNNRLFKFDITQGDKASVNKVAPNGGPGSAYYSSTGHNLSPLFKPYWNSHGGLAQFGYPQTEAFREVNPADGKVYMVQYFERNRFEYHPEYAGTQYEVLLGLLGNQLTADRRVKGESPFNRVADAHYPGGTYFSSTGHTLRNILKAYWEANGGLAIYGFPISEEFEEVNPDDGHTYIVQYFERNRFEYHPDNKGTPYEVLLGLLGNTLLKQKGWL
jgi:hypothetical protein